MNKKIIKQCTRAFPRSNRKSKRQYYLNKVPFYLTFLLKFRRKYSEQNGTKKIYNTAGEKKPSILQCNVQDLNLSVRNGIRLVK